MSQWFQAEEKTPTLETQMIDFLLIIFVPVGLSIMGYVISWEIRETKIDRITKALRYGHMNIQVGKGGKWII